ncbi:MAG: hypothetical protein M1826_000234 [Phylliscum demangeonii]|nr:MAG: hypothetical protein M1826_000234 [Phylliscum demangeonii]
MRHVEVNVTIALFHLRTAQKVTAKWVRARELELVPTIRVRQTRRAKVLGLLVEAESPAHYQRRAYRLRWARHVRAGERWQELSDSVGRGVLLLDRHELGMIRICDMSHETCHAFCTTMKADEDLMAMVALATEVLEARRCAAESRPVLKRLNTAGRPSAQPAQRACRSAVMPSWSLRWLVAALCWAGAGRPSRALDPGDRHAYVRLWGELEEQARLVDIAYCVGSTGIQRPFRCASHCQDFPDFELITAWQTGVLLSDTCGYIALDQSQSTTTTGPRIVLAFRGTYSLTNTIVDLSTLPQKYVPYTPDDDDDDGDEGDDDGDDPRPATTAVDGECANCTVHAGFYFAWLQTRVQILPHLAQLRARYPRHRLELVGHSLGGAVAALAALDLQRRGWQPRVTTFGEPRVGNGPLAAYLDARFPSAGLDHNNDDDNDDDHIHVRSYRRVTHTHDPVPLLPLHEWGYRMHAAEIYIGRLPLPPSVADLRPCVGDADEACIAGERPRPWPEPEPSLLLLRSMSTAARVLDDDDDHGRRPRRDRLSFRTRFPLPSSPGAFYSPVSAHRDYFWRLGLCIPGGDPTGLREVGVEGGR